MKVRITNGKYTAEAFGWDDYNMDRYVGTTQIIEHISSDGILVRFKDAG